MLIVKFHDDIERRASVKNVIDWKHTFNRNLLPGPQTKFIFKSLILSAMSLHCCYVLNVQEAFTEDLPNISMGNVL